MKKLLEIQNQYIEELKRFVTDAVELLQAAKYAAGNNISACTIEDCTAEKRCIFCESWAKVWKDIDAYLKDNE